MSQPLLATNRVSLKYTVAGLQHVWRAYVNAGALIGGFPSFVDRNGLNTSNWHAAYTAWWAILASMWPASAVPAPQATFEQLSGTLWNPIDVLTLPGGGSGGGVYQPAQESTWVIRDSAFKKLRIIFLEISQPYLGHAATGYALSVPTDNVTAGYDGTSTAAAMPFMWQVSRGNRYVLPSGSVAGLTFDQNRKLKRVRHYE